jgi:RHS repeat-associated protein
VISWPGQEQTLDGGPSTGKPAPTSWWGGLLSRKTDGSGLQYMRNRYYDPKTGKFTQVDPIGLGGGLNLYGFAQGDPVNHSDPFGLCPPLDHNVGPECLGLAGFKAAISPLWTVPGRAVRRFIRQASGTAARSTPGQIFGAIGDFVENYQDMRDANTIGADKYFHAKANCEAAQRGSAGASTAETISDTREWSDQHWPKNDPKSASEADQRANRAGRAAGTSNPTGSCSAMVNEFRPRGLSPDY